MSNSPPEHRQADGRMVLAFVCATAFAVVLNGTMLPVALPTVLGVAACVVAVVLLSGLGVGGPAGVTGALVAVVAAWTTLAKIATSTGVSLAVPEENPPRRGSPPSTRWSG